MNKKTFILDETAVPINPLNHYEMFEVPTLPNSYYVAILENGIINTWSGDTNFSSSVFYQMVEFKTKKESLYLTAIDNLLKKNDFLQLTIQLDSELISDAEFEEEIEKNEDKYLIKMNQSFNHHDFKIVTQILSDLNRKFSHDDAAEIFSIPLDKIHNLIDSLELDETI